MCHMIFHTDFARELDRFFLSTVRRHNNFLLRVGLLDFILFIKRGLFLLFLFLLLVFRVDCTHTIRDHSSQSGAKCETTLECERR